MLEVEGLNYWAILIAWIINVGVGAFWYSPAGFSKQWSKYTGVDMMKTPKQETNRAIMFVAISSLLQAFFLALLLNSLAPQSFGEALLATLVLWFGFVAITTIGNTLYQRQSWGLWLINSGFFFVVMLVNATLLYFWS